MATAVTMTANRKQPTRSVRTTAARLHEDLAPRPAIGFFPAITHFTDGLNALPKDVMRHLTTLKETEGKAHTPDKAIAEILSAIEKLPEPPRPERLFAAQAFFGMSMTNSVNGSAPASVVDDPTSRALPTSDADLLGSSQADPHFEDRQRLFAQLSQHLREMTVVLDEKNMVLSSANDTLTRGLARLDSSLPHIESEISDEARLGSRTHWALPHMRESKRAGASGYDRSRRDYQGAHNLVAAAAAVHEGDIAATRSEARREAMMAKRSRNHNFDSDFDDKPGRKTLASGRIRSSDAISGAKGSSQPVKRRRLDKGANSTEGLTSAPRLINMKDSPRHSPQPEPSRRKPKALQSTTNARKKAAGNSPSLASSPSRANFINAAAREQSPLPNPIRSTTARARQSSAQSLAQDNRKKRPSSSTASSEKPRTHGDYQTGGRTSHPDVDHRVGTRRNSISRGNGEQRLQKAGEDINEPLDGLANQQKRASLNLKREESELGNRGQPRVDDLRRQLGTTTAVPGQTRQRANSKTAKNGVTPQSFRNSIGEEGPQPMARSRSNRGVHSGRPSQRDVPSSVTTTVTSSGRQVHRKPEFGAVDTGATNSPARSPSHAESSKNHRIEEADDDDEDEPRYCICGRVSFGDMIACDNELCPHEWFHLPCVGLSRPPSSKTKWYCTPECAEQAKEVRSR